MAGDLLIALGEAESLTESRRVLELSYLAVAAFLGSAALNPAMHRPDSTGPRAKADEAIGNFTARLGLDRLVALMLALLAPLAIVAFDDLRRLRVQAALCTVLATAAVVRLVGAIKGQERLQAELLMRATHDGLTGLPSRKSMVDELARRLRGCAPEVGVLFLNLDDFKTVNDSMGHGAGDDLLSLVADRLRGAIRDADMVGRISGDEFAIVTSHNDADAVQALGDRVRDTLHLPFRLAAGYACAHELVGRLARRLETTTPEAVMRPRERVVSV